MEYFLLLVVITVVSIYLYTLRLAYKRIVKSMDEASSVLRIDVENNLRDIKHMVKDMAEKMEDRSITPRMREDIKEIKDMLVRIGDYQVKEIDAIRIDLTGIRNEIQGFHELLSSEVIPVSGF